ncbi:MAG: DUF89 family protein, partial [Oligosphaeraceae bacterium]|nr:DUF89 family protein [Oligosphaeraceae bacterium]
MTDQTSGAWFSPGMPVALDCLPCLLRQAISVVKKITGDSGRQAVLLQSLLQQASSLDLSLPPPEIARQMHQLLQQQTGEADLYREENRRQNAMALALYPEIHRRVQASEDPLELALRLAIAGNVIDCGVSDEISELEVAAALEKALREPIKGDLTAFRQAIHSARQILYLADNAGEIVFDRLLMEQIGFGKITLAVRGREILNDATRTDAEAAGLDQLVTLIDNGSGVPGTLLADCSTGFRERFAAAELIISKGQGNFETLCGSSSKVFFLFKVKCEVIARRAGMPL